jgi:hypothetical protein
MDDGAGSRPRYVKDTETLTDELFEAKERIAQLVKENTYLKTERTRAEESQRQQGQVLHDVLHSQPISNRKIKHIEAALNEAFKAKIQELENAVQTHEIAKMRQQISKQDAHLDDATPRDKPDASPTRSARRSPRKSPRARGTVSPRVEHQRLAELVKSLHSVRAQLGRDYRCTVDSNCVNRL